MMKICIITGARAEYGLLRPLIEKIGKDDYLELQIVVTGMHLSPEFGFTYTEINTDGYEINEKIEILLSSDTPVGIAKSMGLAMISFSECYERIKPDTIILLGDRYEIFAAVSVASVSRIPVVHLHGGEVTQGAIDEVFRHSITKMSYLHFTSTEEYRQRVIQLGEEPERVFNVGAIGIENIKNMKLLSKQDFQKSVSFKLGVRNILVTFHPVTLEDNTSKEQFGNLLRAIEHFEDLNVIFTKANSDTNGRIINQMIDKYVERNPVKSIAFISMGQLRYLSAIQYVDAVVGNSSSGIIEVPSFKKPTINIGDRQKGRIQANSIINCRPVEDEIYRSLVTVFSNEYKEKLVNVTNPYGDGKVSDKIIKEIKKRLNKEVDLKKGFYDL